MKSAFYTSFASSAFLWCIRMVAFKELYNLSNVAITHLKPCFHSLTFKSLYCIWFDVHSLAGSESAAELEN